MPRRMDCPECKANHISPEDWDYANDGAYPVLTKRDAKKEHSYCGMRLMSGNGYRLMFRPSGRYVGTIIHKGGK
jgi:hypothetical protein